jgi:hypothetical protein
MRLRLLADIYNTIELRLENIINNNLKRVDFDRIERYINGVADEIAERAWELAFEGNRWFDLVRKEMVASDNTALYPYVKPYNSLIPKPQTELDIIKGLKQNEGYE